LITAARAGMARHSLLVGKTFAGDVTVNVTRYLSPPALTLMPIVPVSSSS
jgi:hypothetical protein